MSSDQMTMKEHICPFKGQLVAMRGFAIFFSAFWHKVSKMPPWG